jgi:hypothetical protein
MGIYWQSVSERNPDVCLLMAPKYPEVHCKLHAQNGLPEEGRGVPGLKPQLW